MAKLTTTEARLVQARMTQDGRPCDPKTTLAQIGGLTLMSVSGGRWAEISNEYGESVGVILPCGENRAVEVVLNWADLYEVRRVRLVVSGAKRGEVVVEKEHHDVYFDGLYDLVYTTACWK